MPVAIFTTEAPSRSPYMTSTASSFTSGEHVGLFLLAGTSGVSATAIIGLLSYIAVSFAPPCFQNSYQWTALSSKSIAPSAYVQVHPEDGELVGPLRFTSLISWGGILFRLPVSHWTMMASLSPDRDLLLQGVS